MGTKDVVEQLSKVPLFSGCSRKDLQTIARIVRDIDHPAGTVIAREGDPGVGLFVITEGMTDVTIGGRRRARLGPGDFFGEISLVTGEPRTATVTTRSPSRLLIFSAPAFRSLLHDAPGIRSRVLAAAALRLAS